MLHPQNEDYLLLEKNRNHYFIGDLSCLKLLKLKEEVLQRVQLFHSYLVQEKLNLFDNLFDDRLTISDNDYEEIPLTIDDLKSFPTSFGCGSSFGVIDHLSCPVKLPTLIEENPVINNYLFSESLSLLTAYCHAYFDCLQANLGNGHHVCASITDAYPEGILVAIHLNYHYHQGIKVKPMTELPAAIHNFLSNLDATTEGFFLFSNGLIDERPVANIYYLRSSLESRFSEQTARTDAQTAINLLEKKIAI